MCIIVSSYRHRFFLHVPFLVSSRIFSRQKKHGTSSREEKREIHSRSKESSSMDRCKGHLGRRNDFVVAIHSLFSEDLTRLGAPLLSRVTCLKEVDGRFTQTVRFK